MSHRVRYTLNDRLILLPFSSVQLPAQPAHSLKLLSYTFTTTSTPLCPIPTRLSMHRIPKSVRAVYFHTVLNYYRFDLLCPLEH